MRTKAIGAILILLIIISSLTFGITSNIFFFVRVEEKENIEIENFLYKELTISQRSNLISNGYTLVLAKFKKGCEECKEIEEFLLNLTKDSELKDQIIVQVLKNRNLNILRIESIFGTRNVNSLNKTIIFKNICDLLTKPTLKCALR